MSTDSRQEFIKAAVTFLRNPKLVDSSLQDKLKFLKEKGLSQVEVDEALNLALVNRQQSHHGKWNFLLIFGLCIGGYKLYRAYLDSKKGPSLDQEASGTQNGSPTNNSEIKGDSQQDGQTLSQILQNLSEIKRQLDSDRSYFSEVLRSLKTLLLSHERFAAPPVIPAWQLKDSNDKTDTETVDQGNGFIESTCEVSNVD